MITLFMTKDQSYFFSFLGFGKMSMDIAPVNIKKGGSHPKLMSNDQYPDWLWEINKPKPMLSDLMSKDELDLNELKRMAKLMNRQNIKQNNADGVK